MSESEAYKRWLLEVCNQEYKGNVKAFRVAENVPDVAY